jgi:hypothetical protein
MFEPLDKTPVAYGLKLGRPDNRRYTYQGDRRSMVKEPELMGPDAHGVSWLPVRAYYEDGKTLVVFTPIHPDEIGRFLA